MKNSTRTDQFKRNKDLEGLISEINGLLGEIDKKYLPEPEDLKFPLILIHGVARSGTTLLMQWFANTECFSYPTNFLSRFYGSPYIGAKIQQLLYDIKYNFNNELYDYSNKIEYVSNLGKTSGPLAPNEFWYFWRRFFNYGNIQILSKEQEKGIDTKNFISELALIETVFNKPLVMKGSITSWNIPFIASISDKILFVHIKREPVHNIRSILDARKKYFGTETPWYSFKPPEYDKIKDLSPVEQVSGQIYFTNRAISKGLREIDQKRWLEIDYEVFCDEPGEFFKNIKNMILKNGYTFKHQYKGVKRFKTGNSIEKLSGRSSLFENAFRKFSDGGFWDDQNSINS